MIMKRLVWIFLLSALAYGQVSPNNNPNPSCNTGVGVQIGNCAGLPFPTAVVVTITPPSIPVGGIATIAAQIQMSDSTLNTVDTSTCSLTSSNSSVAAIFNPTIYPANTLIGLSAGTATITCADGSISGAAVVNVTGAPAITQPNAATCGTPPCALTQGTIGTAYSYPLGATAGIPPYTWNISVGSLPAGLSLNSVGCGTAINCNIQGTPSGSPGTTNFTIRVVDAASNAKTLAVSLTTIGAGPTCGPPAYNCTASNVTVPFPTAGSLSSPSGLLVPFSTLASNGQITGTGGTGADGTQVIDIEPVANGNVTGLGHTTDIRVTNYYSNCGVVNELACPDNNANHHTFMVDLSGSDEIMHWNTDDTAFIIGENATATSYLYKWTPGNAASLALAYVGGPAQGLPWGTSKWGPVWSRVNNHTIYTTNSSTPKVTQLQSWDVSVTYPTLPAATNIVDLATFTNAGGGCLSGLGVTVTTDPLNVSTNDTWIADAWSTSGSQNTGRYVVSYSVPTQTCYMWNTSNGQYIVCSTTSCSTRTVACQNCTVSTSVTSISVAPGSPPVGNAVVASSASFVVGDTITISGNTNSSLNGTFTINLIPDSTDIRFSAFGLAGLTGTGGTLSAGRTNPGTFPIHNVKATADGGYVMVAIGGGCDAGSTCMPGPNTPYLFQPTSGKVFALCGATVGGLSTCSGHFIGGGTLNFINNPNQFQWAERLYTTPQSPTVFPSSQPCSPQPGTDWHGGWQNGNSTDSVGFFGYTGPDTTAADYTKCMANEFEIEFPPSASSVNPTGTFKREGHSFVSANACFGVQIATAAISQTGKYLLYTSNMGGGLGCMNGNATGCNQTFVGCSGLANRGDVFIRTLQ